MSFKNDCRRLIALLIWVLWIPNLLANTQSDTIREDNSFIRRFSIHTNTVNWFLTVPNLGVEFDFLNSPENRFSVLLQGGYNWNSSHSFNPRYVLNVSNVSVELRKYWRTGGTVRGAFSKYETRDTTISRVRWFFKKFRRNVLSGRTLTNPRDWRAYYVALYGGYDQYSLACFGKGVQGKGINLGVSGGWNVPLFILKNGRSLDLDLGVTVGAKITRFDRYRYISETGCYEYAGSKGLHVTPYPVIHELRVGLAYRFRSIARKVQGEAERYDKWDNLQTALREKRRAEQDSLFQVRQKEQFQKDSVQQAKKKLKELKKKEKEDAKKAKEEAKKAKSGDKDVKNDSGSDALTKETENTVKSETPKKEKTEKDSKKSRKKKKKDSKKKDDKAKDASDSPEQKEVKDEELKELAITPLLMGQRKMNS